MVLPRTIFLLFYLFCRWWCTRYSELVSCLTYTLFVFKSSWYPRQSSDKNYLIFQTYMLCYQQSRLSAWHAPSVTERTEIPPRVDSHHVVLRDWSLEESLQWETDSICSASYMQGNERSAGFRLTWLCLHITMHVHFADLLDLPTLCKCQAA